MPELSATSTSPAPASRTFCTTAAMTCGLVVLGGGWSLTTFGLISTRLPRKANRSSPPSISNPARSAALGSCPWTIATRAFPSRVNGLGGRGLAGTRTPSGSNSRLPTTERGAIASAGRNVSPNPRRLSRSRRVVLIPRANGVWLIADSRRRLLLYRHALSAISSSSGHRPYAICYRLFTPSRRGSPPPARPASHRPSTGRWCSPSAGGSRPPGRTDTHRRNRG